jgi:hypothetical protein
MDFNFAILSNPPRIRFDGNKQVEPAMTLTE